MYLINKLWFIKKATPTAQFNPSSASGHCQCQSNLRILQAAHDLRSPLAALSMLMSYLPQLPETDRIILRQTVNRIQDIAKDILATK